MPAYRAVFGHVNDVPPGTSYESREEVKAAKLHKENEAGISWGRDDDGERAADAIVLNKGYEDDVDNWQEVIYTGAGGKTRNSTKQTSDQTWDNKGNSSLRRSRVKGNFVRVIRGSAGERAYSPVNGYRYDGLYKVVDDWSETGRSGFKICRFVLHRLSDEWQDLTSFEQQIRDLLHVGAHGGGGDEEADSETVRRRSMSVERIVRKSAVTLRVKRLHGYICQICRTPLRINSSGKNYAEGAHIHALGGPQGGPDVDGNVLCLCPNCHVKLDRGVLYITDDFRAVDRFAAESGPSVVPLRMVSGHRVQERFIRAHRRFWNIVDGVDAS
ncbi:YDG/SRA domain-containing protein [Streptomyces anulatus]|uniref:YDG/SRA domain-containing protein n=1 Tax=Streptomyces anulatus TaxID=1892 RepID=UPI001C278D6C|nr:YDG/SRA domain-containing protein [Streptomyces anulatus]